MKEPSWLIRKTPFPPAILRRNKHSRSAVDTRNPRAGDISLRPARERTRRLITTFPRVYFVNLSQCIPDMFYRDVMQPRWTTTTIGFAT